MTEPKVPPTYRSDFALVMTLVTTQASTTFCTRYVTQLPIS